MIVDFDTHRSDVVREIDFGTCKECNLLIPTHNSDIYVGVCTCNLLRRGVSR